MVARNQEELLGSTDLYSWTGPSWLHSHRSVTIWLALILWVDIFHVFLKNLSYCLIFLFPSALTVGSVLESGYLINVGREWEWWQCCVGSSGDLWWMYKWCKILPFFFKLAIVNQQSLGKCITYLMSILGYEKMRKNWMLVACLECNWLHLIKTKTYKKRWV